MRFVVPLLLALILVSPASAVPLQDLLVPGAELDAGRLQFTDFQLVSSTGISAGSINVRPLAVGGLAFPALDVPHAVTQAYEISFLASADAGINAFSFAVDRLQEIADGVAIVRAVTAGVQISLPVFTSSPPFFPISLHASSQIPPASSVPVFIRAAAIGGESFPPNGPPAQVFISNPTITFAVPEPGSAWIGGRGLRYSC